MANPVPKANVKDAAPLPVEEGEMTVTQQKLPPATRAALRALVGNAKAGFSRDITMDIRQVIPETSKVLSLIGRAPSRGLLRMIENAVKSLPTVDSNPTVHARFMISSSPLAPDRLPQAGEPAVIITASSKSGMMHEYHVPKSDELPAFDAMQVSEGLVAIFQSMSQFINPFSDLRSHALGAGNIYGEQRSRDSIASQNAPAPEKLVTLPPGVVELPLEPSPHPAAPGFWKDTIHRLGEWETVRGVEVGELEARNDYEPEKDEHGAHPGLAGAAEAGVLAYAATRAIHHVQAEQEHKRVEPAEKQIEETHQEQEHFARLATETARAETEITGAASSEAAEPEPTRPQSMIAGEQEAPLPEAVDLPEIDEAEVRGAEIEDAETTGSAQPAEQAGDVTAAETEAAPGVAETAPEGSDLADAVEPAEAVPEATRDAEKEPSPAGESAAQPEAGPEPSKPAEPAERAEAGADAAEASVAPEPVAEAGGEATGAQAEPPQATLSATQDESDIPQTLQELHAEANQPEPATQPSMTNSDRVEPGQRQAQDELDSLNAVDIQTSPAPEPVESVDPHEIKEETDRLREQMGDERQGAEQQGEEQQGAKPEQRGEEQKPSSAEPHAPEARQQASRAESSETPTHSAVDREPVPAPTSRSPQSPGETTGGLAAAAPPMDPSTAIHAHHLMEAMSHAHHAPEGGHAAQYTARAPDFVAIPAHDGVMHGSEAAKLTSGAAMAAAAKQRRRQPAGPRQADAPQMQAVKKKIRAVKAAPQQKRRVQPASENLSKLKPGI